MTFGFALIRELPVAKSVIVDFVELLGPLKAHNFGEEDMVFEVKVKSGKNLDSNAYTTEWLPMHNDLAPRENVPGFQVLYCLENEAAPGTGQTCVADGFAVMGKI